MAASVYQVIPKEVEDCIFRQIEFLDTHICINNPHWQHSGIIIIFCKYFIVILGTLRVSFLDVLFLLLAVIVSELYEKPRRNKDSVTEKFRFSYILYGTERWYSYFRYTGRLFLACALFVAVTLLQLYEKQRRNKDWATEESTRKDLCEGHHFFDLTRSFLCQFLLPYSFTIFPKWRTYWMVPIDIHIAMGGNMCYVENMKISCN